MSIKYMSVVWSDQTIQSRTQLLILLALSDFANDDGFAWPSLETISQKARTSARAVQDQLEELKKAGKLEIQIAKGPKGTNLYRVIMGGVQMPHPAGSRGMVPGMVPPLPAPDPSGTVSDPSLTVSQKNNAESKTAEPIVPLLAQTSSEKPDELKTGSRRKAKPPKHTPEEITRAQDFVRLWCDGFLKATGTAYKPDGRDFKQIYSFLVDRTEPVAELVALAHRAWADEYKAGQAGSISAFTWNYQKLVMAFTNRRMRSAPQADPHAVNGF